MPKKHFWNFGTSFWIPNFAPKSFKLIENTQKYLWNTPKDRKICIFLHKIWKILHLNEFLHWHVITRLHAFCPLLSTNIHLHKFHLLLSMLNEHCSSISILFIMVFVDFMSFIWCAFLNRIYKKDYSFYNMKS